MHWKYVHEVFKQGWTIWRGDNIQVCIKNNFCVKDQACILFFSLKYKMSSSNLNTDFCLQLWQ